MKTTQRFFSLLAVLLLTAVTVHGAAADFIYKIAFTPDGPATLEFGLTAERTNVPYPPIGTPADESINHIFFFGAGDATAPQAADFGQLASCFYSDVNAAVWQLQSISDATVYFTLA